MCYEGKDERGERERGKESALPEKRRRRRRSKTKQENLVIVSTVFLGFSSLLPLGSVDLEVLCFIRGLEGA